jgi:hypothetical protein
VGTGQTGREWDRAERDVEDVAPYGRGGAEASAILAMLADRRLPLAAGGVILARCRLRR